MQLTGKSITLTIIRHDVTVFAFIDDMTFRQLLSPGLVWDVKVP